MKLYFKEESNHSITILSETGETLWQFSNLKEAMKSCREVACMGDYTTKEPINEIQA